VWGEGEAGHLLVADLELGRVRPGVERRLDAPAGPGGGGTEPVDDDLVADEGARGGARGRGAPQFSRVALSRNGLDFEAPPEFLGRPYRRLFRWDGFHYALAMPGVMHRSPDGLTDFEEGPTLFASNQRHTALKLDGDRLSIFFMNAGDCPERILLSTITLTPNWRAWRAGEPVPVLEPELEYEGGHLALEPSRRGPVMEPVCQLRDPAIYREDGRTYLLYAVAGEYGIAELLDDA